MALKIKKRRNIVWNTCLYALLMPVFVLIVNSLGRELSLLNWTHTRSLLFEYSLLMGMGLVSAIGCFYIKRVSVLLLRVTSFVIFMLLLQWLIVDYNKLVLLVIFVFLVQTYYFLAFWSEELDSAFYNPQFTKYDYKDSPSFLLNCQLTTKKGEKINAKITNWDEAGVFCKVIEGNKKELARMKNVRKFKVDFEGKIFEHSCKVVSYDRTSGGVGLEFYHVPSKSSGQFTWNDLFTILQERGIVKELMI